MPQASKSLYSFHQKSPEWLVLHGFDTPVFWWLIAQKVLSFPAPRTPKAVRQRAARRSKAIAEMWPVQSHAAGMLGCQLRGRFYLWNFREWWKIIWTVLGEVYIVWIVADNLIDRNQIRILRNPKPIFGHIWQLILHSSFSGLGRFRSMLIIQGQAQALVEIRPDF